MRVSFAAHGQRPAHVGATCALHPGSPASRGDRDRLFSCAPRRRGTNARGPGRGSGAPPPRTADTWGAVLRVCGVQITGLHSVEKVAAGYKRWFRSCPNSVRTVSLGKKAWDESLTFAEGGRANPVPAHDPWYLMRPHPSRASLHERVKYKTMSGVHSFLFDKGLGARLLGPLMRPVKRHSTADRVFERIEHAIKSPLFGCETCGMCRLAATQYICPETCPKGLADGACGGTTDNLCEFGDRECVHSVSTVSPKTPASCMSSKRGRFPPYHKTLGIPARGRPIFEGRGPR